MGGDGQLFNRGSQLPQLSQQLEFCGILVGIRGENGYSNKSARRLLAHSAVAGVEPTTSTCICQRLKSRQAGGEKPMADKREGRVGLSAWPPRRRTSGSQGIVKEVFGLPSLIDPTKLEVKVTVKQPGRY